MSVSAGRPRVPSTSPGASLLGFNLTPFARSIKPSRLHDPHRGPQERRTCTSVVHKLTFRYMVYGTFMLHASCFRFC